jgi:hypothetical protein
MEEEETFFSLVLPSPSGVMYLTMHWLQKNVVITVEVVGFFLLDRFDDDDDILFSLESSTCWSQEDTSSSSQQQRGPLLLSS